MSEYLLVTVGVFILGGVVGDYCKDARSANLQRFGRAVKCSSSLLAGLFALFAAWDKVSYPWIFAVIALMPLAVFTYIFWVVQPLTHGPVDEDV